jgi:ribonuclease HII
MTRPAASLALFADTGPDLRTLRVAGVDEAGRGPLAGPVAVAAVVFDPARPRINGLDDSKALSAERRDALYPRIVERALAWSLVLVTVEEIDQLNIFQATMLGMRRAVEGVAHVAQFARIDGNRVPKALPCPAEALVGGDALDRSIMAASIVAKVSRDRYMLELHARHPEYGFDQHKGYGTPQHLAALRHHGPCPEHRRSFAPVRACLERSAAATAP